MPETMLSCKASQKTNIAKQLVEFCTHSFSRVKIKNHSIYDPIFRIQQVHVKQLLLNHQADNFICRILPCSANIRYQKLHLSCPFNFYMDQNLSLGLLFYHLTLKQNLVHFTQFPRKILLDLQQNTKPALCHHA